MAFCLLLVGLIAACETVPKDEAATRKSGSAETESKPAELPEEIMARVLRASPVPVVGDDLSNAYDLDPRAARLGQWVFFDPRFSASGEVSCASCHALEHGLSDGRARALGVLEGERNTQGLWNVGLQRWFFWDGRADSLWAQALWPFEGESEHGTSRMAVVHRLARDPRLKRAYEEIFGALPVLTDRGRFPEEARPVQRLQRPITALDVLTRRPVRAHEHALGTPEHEHPDVVVLHPSAIPEEHPHERAWRAMRPEDRAEVDHIFANVGKALAAYMRRLESRDSAFDRFVEALRAGDRAGMAAYPPAARAGLELFFGKASCHLCHHGPLLSDGEFHDIGLSQPAERPADTGRQLGLMLLRENEFNLLGPHNDDASGKTRAKVELLPLEAHGWSEFKTPSLRNVAETAPYFHDGRMGSLREVLDFYSTRSSARLDPPTPERILVPLNLSAEEIEQMLAFLESLSDTDIDANLLRPPSSP